MHGFNPQYLHPGSSHGLAASIRFREEPDEEEEEEEEDDGGRDDDNDDGDDGYSE